MEQRFAQPRRETTAAMVRHISRELDEIEQALARCRGAGLSAAQLPPQP